MKRFLNDRSSGKKMVDKVFKAAVAAKEDKLKHGDQVVDATLGTLYDEDGNFVALKSVWDAFDSIESEQKARYAGSIQGNPDYIKSVKKWLFSDLDKPLNCEVIATPGGAGAISSTIKNMLNPGEVLIKPSQGWGPYKTMAAEFGVLLKDYNMFQQSHFDLSDFAQTCKEVMEEQGKVVVIINDPCHNPTGYTLSSSEWDQIIQIANELSQSGPFTIIHDIAYIDFNHQGNEWKKHFGKYHDLNENVACVVCFSTSKTLTAYGARAGAQVVISNNLEFLNEFKDAAIYSARSIWSTVSNGAMKLFSKIASDQELLDTYMKEKDSYVELLKQRANIFVEEALEIGLEIYPYKEGFFVTIKIEDDIYKEKVYQSLQENHIFTVQVDGGLRIAVCSVPKRKLVGLAGKIKKVM